MSFSLQCDRCKHHSQNDKEYKDFRQLDYFTKGLGHYFTIHLCQRCTKVFQENFMRGRVEPGITKSEAMRLEAAESDPVFQPEQG